MDWGEIGAMLFPKPYAALKAYRDEQQQKDATAELPSMQAAYPAMVDYAQATGTTDPRFWNDSDSRKVLADQGVTGDIGPFAKEGETNPYAQSALSGLQTRAQSEAGLRDYIGGTASPNTLASLAANDSTKQHMAAIRGLTADYQSGDAEPSLEERKYADTRTNDANRSAFLSAISGVGGAYQQAQPILDGKMPTGPNVDTKGLDYSTDSGAPTKPYIMPFEKAKGLILQAASDYHQDPKEALAELDKQYTNSQTDATGQPSDTNWMGKEASRTKEQLYAAAQRGGEEGAKAQSVLTAMQKDEIAQKAAARQVIVNNPTPTKAGSGSRGRMQQAFDNETRSLVFVDTEDIKANPTRYAPAGAQTKANQQQTLIEDIRGTLNNTMASLEKMKPFDNTQQAQIALMLKHRDPSSALSNFLGSKVGQTLSPDQVDYITDLAIAKENILGMRSLLGAGQGSESQRAAIEATLPGAVSPNKAFAKVQLQKALRTLDRLGRGVPKANLKPEGEGEAPKKQKAVVERRKSKSGKILVKYSDGSIGEE